MAILLVFYSPVRIFETQHTDAFEKYKLEVIS
jgi:hypothetical protein